VSQSGRAGRPEPITIRVRLGLALALALAPVLILSAVQSGLNFQREMRERQASLAAAAERSASTARARIEAAEVLLQTLAPGSVGFQCAARLAEIKGRIPGYANLIRFDSMGRVACAADSVPPDVQRRERPWFSALLHGQSVGLTSDPEGAYSGEPALLAAVRATNERGEFDGALAAAITLESLRPEKADRSLPANSEVALVDREGRFLTATRLSAFPLNIRDRLNGRSHGGASLWLARDRTGVLRTFSAAPLAGDDVYVALSAPSQGLVSWAWVNPLSTLALPILAFSLALAAVWIVAERQVVRWIAYLQRIAAIYARGRFSVHPIKADAAPPEIRDLAHTLDAMAQTIAARDASLVDSLSQKDALMREIHHRVKNNLQIISSLLNMQQRALADAAARAAMSDTRQRIAALALIYRALYQGPDLRRVDLREFLDELIAQLVTGEPGKGGPIRTEMNVEPLIIDPDRLAPLALFAVEAITNAMKHGVGQAGGVLSVAFSVHGSDAELSISDTGAGRGGGAVTVGQGVGRTLMTAFARQLRGEVDFCQNADGGITARLVFPTPDLPATSARANLSSRPASL
jgi:two-component sensor histidine kinase